MIKMYNKEKWNTNLQKVKNYIDTHHKFPERDSKNKQIRGLNAWISKQKIAYKKKIKIFNNNEYCNIWKMFIDDYEIDVSTWNTNLQKVKDYIDTYHKIPEKNSHDIQNRGWYIWISKQNIDYKKKIKIFNNDEYCDIWKNFINDYIIDTGTWNTNLQKVKNYIDTYHKIPERDSCDKQIRGLNAWVSKQKIAYKKKIKIFNNDKYCDLWKNFINDYVIDTSIWNTNLQKVKNYMDTYHKIPERDSCDKQIRGLNIWISKQNIDYKKKIKIFNNDKYRDLWKNFINDYVIDTSIWNTNLQKVKDYIDTHHRFPERNSKDKQIRGLNAWVSKQKIAYKKKIKNFNNDKYCDLWKNFINDYEVSLYTEPWNDNLQKVKNCMESNYKFQGYNDKQIIVIKNWIRLQNLNYKNNSFKQQQYYDAWKELIHNYDINLINYNYRIWNNILQELNTYIDLFHKLPKRSSKDPNESKLSMWITTQKVNYKNKYKSMSDEIIRDRWDNFRSENKSLFNY